MTFLNLNLGSPVVRAAVTVTGEPGVVGARFIMDGGPSEGGSGWAQRKLDARSRDREHSRSLDR